MEFFKEDYSKAQDVLMELYVERRNKRHVAKDELIYRSCDEDIKCILRCWNLLQIALENKQIINKEYLKLTED